MSDTPNRRLPEDGGNVSGSSSSGSNQNHSHRMPQEIAYEMRRDENFDDKDRTRKHVKYYKWNKVVKEEREPERWGGEKKELLKEEEKLDEKENDHVKRKLWSSDAKEVVNELVYIYGKSVEQETSGVEPKKKDQDPWKNVDKEARDRKKEKGTDEGSDKPDNRIRYNEKESGEGCMVADGGTERRKRMLQPRNSPQMGSNPRHRAGSNDTEGSNDKGGVSCIAYKTGECVQELVKLWNEYKLLQTDKAWEGSQNGPTLEIRISVEYVTATNRQVKGGQLWGTDVYTVDSDLVAVLMHTGYCRSTGSPSPATPELRAIIRVLPPQDCYVSTLRNNVRIREWRAEIDCSYRVERCCIVESTLCKKRFVRDVTTKFNLCMEPWLKYSISVVADKGLEKSLFTSARLKRGEVLCVETCFRRYDLCFNGVNEIKGMDGNVTVFRWSLCKRHLPQKMMLSFGIPLPLQHVEGLEDDL